MNYCLEKKVLLSALDALLTALHYSVSSPFNLPPIYWVFYQKNNLTYGPIIGGSTG